MSAGLPKYVVVNLDQLEKSFETGSTVNLASLQEKNLLNVSGRDSSLPLKVGYGMTTSDLVECWWCLVEPGGGQGCN
jgi:large subunit ribosomal protein L15